MAASGMTPNTVTATKFLIILDYPRTNNINAQYKSLVPNFSYITNFESMVAFWAQPAPRQPPSSRTVPARSPVADIVDLRNLQPKR